MNRWLVSNHGGFTEVLSQWRPMTERAWTSRQIPKFLRAKPTSQARRPERAWKLTVLTARLPTSWMVELVGFCWYFPWPVSMATISSEVCWVVHKSTRVVDVFTLFFPRFKISFGLVWVVFPPEAPDGPGQMQGKGRGKWKGRRSEGPPLGKWHGNLLGYAGSFP